MRIRHYLREGTRFAYLHAEAAYVRRRPTLRRWTAELRVRSDEAATRAGAAATRGGRSLLLRPHRGERVPVPVPLDAGGHSFDVVEDLVEFTRLPRPRVVELIQRRHESFRSEWHSVPESVRDDHWYYLSSRLYLFANSIHLHDEPSTVATITSATEPGASVLDFGGGTGNLALALAASGRAVSYLEVSALQKDFMRFRAQKHRLAGAVEILDSWNELPRAAFDAVIALDVLEHLPDLVPALTGRLLPALRPGGVLVEASPFVQNISNPMHHEGGEALDATLAAAGLALERRTGDLRFWRSGGRHDGEDVAADRLRVDRAERP